MRWLDSIIGECGGKWIHIYVWLSPFAVHLKLSHPLLISYTPVQNKSLILEHMDQPDLVLAGTKIKGRRVFGINCDKEGKGVAV